MIPTSRVIGRLNTLNAYACPIDRWIASAAGGTIHRLNPAPATVRLLSRNPLRLTRSPVPRAYDASNSRTRRSALTSPLLCCYLSFARLSTLDLHHDNPEPPYGIARPCKGTEAGDDPAACPRR